MKYRILILVFLLAFQLIGSLPVTCFSKETSALYAANNNRTDKAKAAAKKKKAQEIAKKRAIAAKKKRMQQNARKQNSNTRGKQASTPPKAGELEKDYEARLEAMQEAFIKSFNENTKGLKIDNGATGAKYKIVVVVKDLERHQSFTGTWGQGKFSTTGTITRWENL